MLSARGIPAVVGAENQSSMLGGLGGGFLSLDIWVAEEDSEEAAALLRDARGPGVCAAGDGDGDGDGECDAERRDRERERRDIEADADRDADREGYDVGADCDAERDVERERERRDIEAGDRRDGDHDADGDLAQSVCVASDAFHLQIDRRRRTGIALLLGCCITFGTAHMFARAWLRGLALGAVELIGILQVAAGHRGGTIAIVGAVAADVIGAVWRIWSAQPSPIPEARLRRLRAPRRR
jgi:hypothetical protein